MRVLLGIVFEGFALFLVVYSSGILWEIWLLGCFPVLLLVRYCDATGGVSYIVGGFLAFQGLVGVFAIICWQTMDEEVRGMLAKLKFRMKRPGSCFLWTRRRRRMGGGKLGRWGSC